MDVRCGRCGTEYEFDDALISERGTTVKCTNCGYQFKVFPDAAAAAPERWVVRTLAGRELVYTTLKDLQRGIARGHVSANDMLSRGNRPARPLSAIPELEPFLKPGTPTVAVRPPPRTLQGVAPAANASNGGDGPPSIALPEPAPSIAPKVRQQSLTPAWDPPVQSPGREAPAASRPPSPAARPPANVESRPSTRPTARPPANVESRPSVPVASRPGVEASAAVASQPAPATHDGPRFSSSAASGMTIPGGISLTAPTLRRTPPGGTGLLHDLPPVSKPASEAAAPPPRFEAAEPPTIPRYFANLVPGANGQATDPQEAPAPAPAPSVRPAISVISRAREVPGARTAPEVEPKSPASRDLGPETPEQTAARGLAEARALLQHDDQTDPYYVRTPTQRHARSRWLVLVVVLAAGVLLVGTVGKRYLAKYTKGSSLAASQTDATVTALLAEGERSLARGDLQGAQDAFGKASARAENDRQVLTALATLEVLRADLLWLKQRLLEARNDPARSQNARELARQVVRVRGLVERTKLVAPEGAATARLLVHAKRLSGEVAEARRHVAALTEDASLPENAYALAALDMADQAPVWSSIVHRLRISAEAEGPVGLSRAALVYALARSEQADAAKAELEKLAKANPSHPLIFDLRAFLDQNPAAAAEGEPSPAASAAGDDDAGEPASGDARAGVGGDFRAQLKQAYAAAEKGQLATAERLYNAVLAKQPGNTEALSGLADVAHRRNDTSKSAQLYEEVLRKNPSYLPALMASADQKWSSGDHAGAAGLYRRILEQAGADSSYGRRSAQRIAQAEFEASAKHDQSPVTEPSIPHGSETEAPSPAPDEPAPAPAAPEAPAEPAPPEGGEAQPHIDTTDLPDLNQ